MALASPKMDYSFEEFFPSLLKIKLVRRVSPDSPVKLCEVKLMRIEVSAVCLQIISMVIFIVKLFEKSHVELSELSDLGACVIVFTISMCRGIILLSKRQSLDNLLMNLERIFLHRTQSSPARSHIFHENAKKIIRNNSMVQRFYISAFIVFISLPTLQALFDWIINGNDFVYQYPVNSWLPFEEKGLIHNLLVHGCQVFASYGVILFLFNEDVFFSTSVSQICMHFKCLSESLSQSDARSPNNFEILKDLIRYHHDLERLKKNVDDVFSLSTFIGFSAMKMALCVFVFALTQEIYAIKLLRFFLGMATLLGPVYLRCSNGTAITDDSSNLVFSIYDQNWYEGTPKYRKMLVIMMIRANVPLELRATRFSRISVDYFKEIVIQAYHILTFLYNFL